MANATVLEQYDFRPNGGAVSRTAWSRFVSADSMEWTRFEGAQVILQLTGTASAASVVVERCARNPDLHPGQPAPLPAQVDSTGLSGNPAVGATAIYLETAAGWWRARVTAVSGGWVEVALSGAGG